MPRRLWRGKGQSRDRRFQRRVGEEDSHGARRLTETMAVHADVRNEDSVKKVIDQVINRFGQIDVMMNNAAIVPHFAWNIPRWPLIADMPVDFWDRVVHTNLIRHLFRHQACPSRTWRSENRPHHQSVRRWRREAGRRRDLHGDQGRHPHVLALRRRGSARIEHLRGHFLTARADRH